MGVETTHHFHPLKKNRGWKLLGSGPLTQFVISEAPLGSIFGAVCGGHVADFMAYLLPRRATIFKSRILGLEVSYFMLFLICLIPNKAVKIIIKHT